MRHIERNGSPHTQIRGSHQFACPTGTSCDLGYNAEHRSIRQADVWDAYLRSKIQTLATGYDQGRPVENFPGLKHVTAKRRNHADGHIFIYEIDPAARRINILHVFHTSQDVQGRLRREGQ